MPEHSHPLAAIDLGSSVITTAVGALEDHGGLYILGVGQAPSRGIEGGRITHVSRAAESIRQSLDHAESSSGRQIVSVGFCITGAHLRSENNIGQVAINEPSEPIQDDDLSRADSSGRAVTINSANHLLHDIPRYYIVDSDRRTFDPRGQHGQRLQVSMHLVTASQSDVQNAYNCVTSTQVGVTHMAAKPVVAAERAVRVDEKEHGVLVVGLDAGTTTLTAFEDGAISHTSAIEVGTSHIARDLSVGLRCNIDEARRIMLQHGLVIPQLVPDPDAMIELRGFSGVPGQDHAVSHAAIVDIIHERVREIITMIHSRIIHEQLQPAASGGIVLTGSGAMLGGIDLLFSKACNAYARVADPGELHGLTDRLSGPDALGAIGMLDYMFYKESLALDGGHSASYGGPSPSLFGSITSGLASIGRVFSTNA